ncbi:MAG: TetR family transcriptional regulator [Acidimicrobiales bacterium]
MLPWAPVSGLPAPDGRRERKKSRTRDGLVAAATELFASNGYAATSIEEITDRADVSPRTFFRYFATKEDVLFPEHLEAERLLSAMADQPSSSSDLEAIRDACLAQLPYDDATVRRVLLLKKAIRSTPALEGRDLALQHEFCDHLAVAVALRNGLEQPDDHCHMVAALAQAVIRLAFERWADTDGREDLDTLLRHRFELVGQILAPARPRPPSRR